MTNHNPHFWDGLSELPSVFCLSVAFLSYRTPPGRAGLAGLPSRGSCFCCGRDRRGRLLSISFAYIRSRADACASVVFSTSDF
jgi:hypothetical protein